MSRDRESGVQPPNPSPPGWAQSWPSWPLLPMVLVALALLTCALLAAWLARGAATPGWLTALALLLATMGALTAGAYWSRQRQMARLHDARTLNHLLAQLSNCWSWQSDAQHRLTRFQPPQAAPASAWVADAFSGVLLWERFDDGAQGLRQRLEAQQALHDLTVHQRQAHMASRRWRLRALPRFDARGRFAGYVGVAEPTELDEARDALQAALQQLLAQDSMAFCQVQQAADGWVLHQASPAACVALGLRQRPGQQLALPMPWPQALGVTSNAPPAPPAPPASASNELPAALRHALTQPAAGATAGFDGWQGRWLPLSPADGESPAANWLLALSPPEAMAQGESDAEHSAHAMRTLLAEHEAFAYTISHDLRAPIRVVEGFGRILKEDYATRLDRVGNDHLERIMAAAARMNQMIDAMLALSQLSTRPLLRQPVNLSQLAGFVVDDLRRQFPERQVSVEIAPRLGAVGDPTLLRLVLDNLLGNAWKYSAKQAQADIRFELLSLAGRPTYCISDNGAGFDMRFVDRLFGVFSRLHSASDFQGTGVGLASVRRIVRRHAGEVWAEAEVGKGARFYFTLGD